MGGGTLRDDDPHLAVRGIEGATQPLRIALDTRATLPASARILDDAAPTLLVVGQDADTRHLPGVDLLRLPLHDGRVAVHDLLAALHARGTRSVLLEGGPVLAGAFLEAGAVDRVIGYLAPALLGAGPAALADAGVSTIAGALRLDLTEAVRIGPDLRITAVPATATESAPATKEH